MNTKQVEELVGISRQNIRYYEKAGLLAPKREEQNSYRDYSEEDVSRLKLIKMLRLLNMPLKEIEKIMKGEITIQEAVSVHQKELLEQQKQLHASIDICNLLRKEKVQEINIDKYLSKMEHMEKHSSVFAKIRDDYKQIMQEEEEKMLVFYTDCRIHTFGDFEKVLKEYAKTLDKKFKVKERGKYPKFYLNDELYQAVYSFEKPGYRIVCMKMKETKKEELFLKLAYQKTLIAVYTMFANIKRHAMKSVCNFIISCLLVILLGIYIGNLSQINTQIEELPDASPVYGTIYNETGSESTHLLIKESVVEGIRKSAYTDEISETVELIARTNTEKNYQVLALQDHELDSLQSGQCLANPNFLKVNGLKVGDKINVSIYCYIADIMLGGLTEHFMADVKLEIVGSREMEEDLQIPLKDAKKIFIESKNAYYASSLSFHVKEPKALNFFKAEMKELGLLPIQSGVKDTFYGTALGMEDAIFIETSTKLEKNKILFQSFLPMILFLLFITEYLVSYLFLQSRRQEFAIMRALGKSKKECRWNLMSEQFATTFAGIIIGVILCRGMLGLEHQVILWVSVAFIVIAVMGIYGAIRMLGRFSVAAVLARRD